MKMAVVQTRPIQGDVSANIRDHQQSVEAAVTNGAKAVFFPEMSITGYELTRAADWAMEMNDDRLDCFQTMSDDGQITIGVGLPARTAAGLHISHVIFQPNRPRKLYSKKYLHADEEPFFVCGDNFPIIPIDGFNIALAICYELSIPAHVEAAVASDANMYVACTAKSASGVDSASARLADIAQTHHIPVLFSNCVGQSDGFTSTGNTAAWDRSGRLLAQLNETESGILIVNSESNEWLAVSD